MKYKLVIIAGALGVAGAAVAAKSPEQGDDVLLKVGDFRSVWRGKPLIHSAEGFCCRR
jgi:hypothetical protein